MQKKPLSELLTLAYKAKKELNLCQSEAKQEPQVSDIYESWEL